MSVSVTVPASSANLGPGYDAFGLALGLYNEFEGELAATWRVEVRGEGAGRLHADESNEVVRAMKRVFAEVEQPDLAADIVCHNGIPVGRGLGSSAAAIVGGLVLGDALAGTHLGKRRLLEIAAEAEGHADNVAAALYGGFTVVSGAVPHLTCAHVDPAGGLAALIVIGEQELSTSLAREALPASVPHADAAANAGRAALVALGLATGTREFLETGLHDAIHERYREELVPDLDAIRSLLEAVGAGPAVLSGAGPTVIALVQELSDARALERARVLAEVARTALDGIGRGRVLPLPIDRVGARQSA
ncbi:MAG: homoserine kinase [Coriobacteriia bacterium]|nr:homoserine kinase [Coriobacteriia bacterium]